MVREYDLGNGQLRGKKFLVLYLVYQVPIANHEVTR